MAWWQALLLVAGLALAGCASKAPVDAGALPSTASTGAIAGLVVDDAIRPSAGAAVHLHGGALAVTDAQGRFLLEGLAPGSYLLEANHTGFLPAQTLVQVESGHVAHPRIQLATALVATPYHDTYKFKGHTEASLGLGTEVLDRSLAGGLLTCTCTFGITSSGPLASILLEATWQDSVADPAGPTKYNWQLTVDGNDAQATGQGENPIRHEVQRLDFTNRSFEFDLHPSYTLHMYPDAVWPAVSQDYQIFVTLWYLDRPPSDFSIVNGSPS